MYRAIEPAGRQTLARVVLSSLETGFLPRLYPARTDRRPIGEVPAMREQITSIIINEITRSLLQRRDSSAKQSDG